MNFDYRDKVLIKGGFVLNVCQHTRIGPSKAENNQEAMLLMDKGNLESVVYL